VRGAGAARGLRIVDLCLVDIFHIDTILPPSLPLGLCDQLGLLAITIFPFLPLNLPNGLKIPSLLPAPPDAPGSGPPCGHLPFSHQRATSALACP
jgi:hypothetical protein